MTSNLHPLHSLFEPQSVAVIGASTDPNRIGGRVLRYILAGRFQGAIYPVSASSDVVQGIKAYRSVLDIPGKVDQAIIVVPASACLGVVQECASKGVASLQIYSSGFAEAGVDGARNQEQIMAIARRHGIRVLGPNSIGLISLPNQYLGTFSSSLNTIVPTRGATGLVTQSGAFGAFTYSRATRRGIGFSRIVATGNEADVDVAEAIEFMAQDERTNAIFVAVEGCRHGQRLREALLGAAEFGKPCVLMKVGASEAGAQAAETHTGALSGNDAVLDVVVAECGAYRVQTIDLMLDMAYLAQVLKDLPRSSSLGVVTVSGGMGVLLADEAEKHGLALPVLPEEARDALQGVLPFATVENPFDTTADVSKVKDGLARSLEAMVSSTNWGAYIVFMPPSANDPVRFEATRNALVKVAKAHRQANIVLVGTSVESVRIDLERSNIAFFDDPSRAVAAIAGWVRWSTRCAQLHAREAKPSMPAGRFGDSSDEDSASELGAKKLLAEFGLPILEEQVFGDVEAAKRFASRVGYPVVAKISSPDIQHKTEVNGVRLNIESADQLERAFTQVLVDAARAKPDAHLEGVLIAPQIADGVEVILGLHDDPTFGLTLMFGMGGTAVELYRDVAFASLPVSRERARFLVGEVKGSALLTGWRGAEPLDVEALVDAIVALSRFGEAFAGRVDSVDINPLRVRASGVMCLDAVVSLKADTSTRSNGGRAQQMGAEVSSEEINGETV